MQPDIASQPVDVLHAVTHAQSISALTELAAHIERMDVTDSVRQALRVACRIESERYLP